MKIKRGLILTLAIMFTLCSALVMHPVITQAATNKVMKVSDLSFRNKKAANRFRGANLRATPLKPDKLTKKSMKLSGKVYIPAAAFKKAGDEILVSPVLSLWKYPPTAENNNAGEIYAKYDIILKYTSKKKIALYKEYGETHKRTKAGSYASVKKDGDYYLVTIKNVPITGTCFDENDEFSTINTKKKFILNPGFDIFSTTNKAWKGTICMDDIKLKSASKTQTVTFNKKDYQGTYANNWAEGGDKEAVIGKK